MPSICKQCGRTKARNFGRTHICDLVTLSDGHTVHASRVAIGGDLHDSIGDKLKVIHRFITPEMLAQKKKGRL
jgi:hypothetical protein